MPITVLNLVMTFDGYIAAVDDGMGWLEKYHSPDFDFSTFTSNVGAIITGKRSYDLGVAHGWFKNEAYGPSPIFVVCHTVPAVPSADADFRFITTGIEDAHHRASAAAGDKWIYLFGGANIFQQFFNKDLVDEMRITIAPTLIGKGIRLFDHLAERRIELEKVDVVSHPNGMIETNFRIVKPPKN